MDAVLRAASIYFFLVVVFRVVGKRGIAQVTTFDLVLLLIISEATQQALLSDDFSVTNALLVITVLVALDVALSLLAPRFGIVSRLVESVPLVIVEDGEPIRERMRRERIDESEILEAARELQGLERMDQIKYAVLERSGRITVVPADQGG